MFAAGVPEKLILTKLVTAACKLLESVREHMQPSMEKVIDRVIADPARSVSTESQLRDDHGTVTNSAIPTSVANKGASLLPSLLTVLNMFFQEL